MTKLDLAEKTLQEIEEIQQQATKLKSFDVMGKAKLAEDAVQKSVAFSRAIVEHLREQQEAS